jgi:hypothetical protein
MDASAADKVDQVDQVAVRGAAESENLIPLTWATCAYVGNGEIGLRVESEEGGTGVLHLLIDNVRLGALSKRLPNGYFRLVTHASSLPLTVKMRTRISTVSYIIYGIYGESAVECCASGCEKKAP